jgi:hypothetical protein
VFKSWQRKHIHISRTPTGSPETLALNRYLSQQVAFGVQQKKPVMVDEAVQYTLELVISASIKAREG